MRIPKAETKNLALIDCGMHAIKDDLGICDYSRISLKIIFDSVNVFLYIYIRDQTTKIKSIEYHNIAHS